MDGNVSFSFCKNFEAEGNKIGYPSNFTIYDTQDSKSLIKVLYKNWDMIINFIKKTISIIEYHMQKID